LALAAVGVALLLLFVLPKVVTTAVSIVLYPFEATRVWVLESSSSFPQYWRDRRDLLAELEAAKQKIAVTEGAENTAAKLQAENEEFRKLCKAVPEERVIARVVGRPPELPYDVMMLDRGTDFGIVESAPVFAGTDQVIGYVSRVYAHTALVTLVTTASFQSIAYIIGPNIYTYAEGMGGGILRVAVPQGLTLTKGDTVILPALDSGVYGTIQEIVTSPTKPEQYGYVPLSNNLQSMQYVSVGHEAIIPHSYADAQEQVTKLRQDLFAVELPPGVLVTPELGTTSPAIASTSIHASSTTLP
jgi:cell shape-determining protein MreC